MDEAVEEKGLGRFGEVALFPYVEAMLAFLELLDGNVSLEVSKGEGEASG